MIDDRSDFLKQYHNITHKLRKKRILKKPNVAEAGLQFEQLGKNFEKEDLVQYTGLSYQAAAKCQNSLGNTLEEGLLLLKSSQKFMSSYLENLNERCISNNAYLNHSYMLYKDCLARLNAYEEQNKLITNAVVSGITFEMAGNLSDEADIVEEGCQEYEASIKFLSNSLAEKINCIQKIISLKIKLGDYRESLILINELIEEAQMLPNKGLKEEILCNAEVTRIILHLIVQPTPHQISPASASFLEKYAWVETSSNNDVDDLSSRLANQGLFILGEELYLKLQSLVMACQYCDRESLELLGNDLIKYLTNEQKVLLQILIQQYVT